MLRVQNQTHVHDPRHQRIRFLAGEHIQEIFGVTEIGARFGGFIAVTEVFPHGHYGCHAGNNFYCHIVDVIQIFAGTGIG